MENAVDGRACCWLHHRSEINGPRHYLFNLWDSVSQIELVELYWTLKDW